MPASRPRTPPRRETRAAPERESRRAGAARPSAAGPGLFPLLVIGAGLAAYHNSCAAPFVFDDVSIAETPELHQLWPPRALAGSTRPLVQLTLALNYAVGGLNVRGYHVLNLAIHVLAALTLFGLVRRTLRTSRLDAECGRAASGRALAVSLIWTVHPLQTEGVTYVVQRAESLMALFYLLTLYCAARGATSPRGRRWYAAAVAACALGALSKPVIATAPIAVLLYDRVFLTGSWRQALRARAVLYAGLAASWAVLAWVLAGPHESATTAGFSMSDLTPFEYARSEPRVIVRYLRLAFWPRGLVLDYGWPVASGVAAIVLPALLLAGLGALTVWLFRRRSELGFLGASFFLALAPSSSVIPIKDLAFEHRMYLPLAALIASTVVGGERLVRRAVSGELWQVRIAAGLTAALVVTLGALTIARNRDYRSAVVMWTDVVGKRPANPRARNNLGDALFDEGRVAEAAAQLREALRLDRAYPDAHNNLGRALAAQGEYADASAHYLEALRLKPDYPEAWNNLGAALAEEKRYGEAEAHYAQALRLKPDYPEARNNLGVALAGQGRYVEAEAQYAQALRLRPDYAEAYSNVGNVLARQGRVAEAVSQYLQALRISPEFAQVHYNLGLALAAQGRREEAKAHFAEAVRLRPDLDAARRESGAPTTERAAPPED